VEKNFKKQKTWSMVANPVFCIGVFVLNNFYSSFDIKLYRMFPLEVF